MTLTELIAEMEIEGRVPALQLEAYKQTLNALVAIADRLAALEFRTEALLETLEQIMAGPQKRTGTTTR